MAGVYSADGSLSVWNTAKLGAHQSVAYTGTAGVITNAILATKVRVFVTTDAYVKVGASPTATTSDVYIPAGSVEYFSCAPTDKVSAVQVASGGTLHVTACS